MSSIIAVCVSFIGLALVLINAVIFIQMILSFPAMMSSNSQSYIQQQRKHHHIPSPGVFDSSHLATSATYDADVETETEQAWVADESLDRWLEDLDEQTDDCGPEVQHVPRHSPVNVARGPEPITRGRSLRRKPRRHVPRTVFRVRDDFDLDLDEDSDHVTSGMNGGHVDIITPTCVTGWRSVEWTR
ncbi:hypothetical protein VPNG_07548 [Cytospora leucostoma]|uniref:Uncharacterized protein n=1 Tax=Cytospora leucostoma TaxID=1230097 RepID=A0A423WS53_9PEZI|nr:hypothetical protein VPNG_07548 [Cytospora leucostoma]